MAARITTFQLNCVSHACARPRPVRYGAQDGSQAGRSKGGPKPQRLAALNALRDRGLNTKNDEDEDEYSNIDLKPFVVEEEDFEFGIPQTARAQRDFVEEMRAFPEGVVFMRGGDGADTASCTTNDYNIEMQERMKSDICYIHEAGANYTHILPALICGSCPQTKEEIDYMTNLGVTRILNLQQQQDWQKFGIDFDRLQHRCQENGSIEIVRSPMEDFCPSSLVAHLPHAVQTLHEMMEEGHMVYVHCTAGLGRAPAVIIAYLHWMCGMSLTDAYSFVTSRRKCHPKAAAIRKATMNLTMGVEDTVSFSWAGSGNDVAVLGTFNDWQTPGIPLDRYCDDFHLSELCLPVGVHQYKYIVDSNWYHSDDEPQLHTAGNVNNVVLVKGVTGGGHQFTAPSVKPHHTSGAVRHRH